MSVEQPVRQGLKLFPPTGPQTRLWDGPPPAGDAWGEIPPRRGCPAKGGSASGAGTTTKIRPGESTGSAPSAPASAAARHHRSPASRGPAPTPPRSGRGLRSLRGNGPHSTAVGRSRPSRREVDESGASGSSGLADGVIHGPHLGSQVTADRHDAGEVRERERQHDCFPGDEGRHHAPEFSKTQAKRPIEAEPWRRF